MGIRILPGRTFGFLCIVVGLLAIGLLFTGNALAQTAPIGRDAAVSIVTTTELGGSTDGVRLYVYPRLLSPGETISAWKRNVFAAPSASWFVFVDPTPGANWEHPCSYYFVDATSGAVSRFAATTPPTVQTDLVEITHGHDNPAPGTSEEALRRYSEELSRLPKPPSRGQAWALIISGGANQSNNHIRYYNDVAFIYRTLVQYYGYADDHIRVCMSDGTNPAADRSDGTNSPPDLDGDGDGDIDRTATLADVGAAFTELAGLLSPSDQLFIFTTDHGGQNSGQSCYLNLWNWEELQDTQMATYVSAVPAQTIICTFEQCYSGGMIDNLTGNGRVIMTAALWSELSWAMGPDYMYDTFVYHWTSAVAGRTPSGVPVNADTNGDGLVSMREAFLYAQANDHDNEHPQYDSTPADLGTMLNLFGNMDGVYLAVDHFTVDDDNTGASHGNGNGVIEFGETVELTVALHNMGQADAQNVSATLTAGSPFVTLVQATAGYGSIPADGIASNAQPFVFTVAPNVPDGADLEIAMNVTEEPGTLPLSLDAGAPSYFVTVSNIDDRNGDGDGLADPGENVGVTLHIENHGSAATPFLTGVLQSGGYFQSDGVPQNVGVIPAGGEVGITGFTVQISPDCPPTFTGHMALDLSAPDYAVSTDLTFWVGPWFDDAELDQGWTLGAPGDNATTGIWVRADPVGTMQNGQPAQSEDDHTPMPGHICFVTGNGSVGGLAGDSDVDGGKTTLLSPVFNVEGATAASISYWRWYTNNLGNSPGLDWWNVDVTADGTNWVHLEHTTDSANSWTEKSFDLAGLVPLTGTVQFRFIAEDVSPGSLIEAAVDDITVSILRMPSTGIHESGAPLAAGLGPCGPNPVGSGAVLRYRLAARGPVKLELYDVAGRRVRTLFDGTAEAGEHALAFAPIDQAGRRIASGVYFVRLEAPGVTQVRQVSVIR